MGTRILTRNKRVAGLGAAIEILRRIVSILAPLFQIFRGPRSLWQSNWVILTGDKSKGTSH